eukprot:SAG11_NODE_3581_length_2353_cov_2.078971_2_plen_76_part_00
MGGGGGGGGRCGAPRGGCVRAGGGGGGRTCVLPTMGIRPRSGAGHRRYLVVDIGSGDGTMSAIKSCGISIVFNEI